MPRPQHKNPGLPPRTATAPYNFIPLPSQVVRAVETPELLPSHGGTFDQERYQYSGFFEVELTTRSPLFIRCPLRRALFDLDEQGRDRHGQSVTADTPYPDRIRNIPDFFHRGVAERPVIPGSSLRGMLRTLLEIVGHGKMEQISERQLFFRTLDDSALGKAYGNRMVDGEGDAGDGYRPRTRPGFLRAAGDGTFQIEPCDLARVELEDVWQAFGLASESNLYDGTGPNATPRWAYQHQRVWVRLDPAGVQDHRHSADKRHPAGKYLRYWEVLEIRTVATAGYEEATLVLTGKVQKQHMAFVFLDRPGAQAFDVGSDIIERFCDDDQLSQWQESAFPCDQPTCNARRQPGHLRDGEPVFYLIEDGQLTFLGRAQMFRLPYQQRVIDLVPQDLRRPGDIDFADALFGYIRKSGYPADAKQGDPARAYAGRVSVTDAEFIPGQDGPWYCENPIRPKRLASPKPTAIQHYLVQTADETKIKNQVDNQLRHLQEHERQKESLKRVRKSLLHYDSNSGGTANTEPRGFKRYWHHQQPDIAAGPDDDISDAQDTQFRPVDIGKRFVFRVHFDSLAAEELGALCWILRPQGHPDRQFWHQLGMGKPLGMGSVSLETKLHLIDHRARYSKLFDGKRWMQGGTDPQPVGLWRGQNIPADREQTPDALLRAFEKAVLRGIGARPNERRLADTARVQMVLKMLDSAGQPPAQVRTLPLQGGDVAFQKRPVLPDPRGVGQNQDYRIPAPTPIVPGLGGAVLDDKALLGQITRFKGTGESHKLHALVDAIAKKDAPKERCGYAKLLMKEIKKHRSLKSDPKHVNAIWRKTLDQIIGEDCNDAVE